MGCLHGVSRSAVLISARSVVTTAAWASARGFGRAGLVGVSDDGDACQVPGHHVGERIPDQDALGVLGAQDADCLAYPVGIGFHPLGVVVIAGDDPLM